MNKTDIEQMTYEEMLKIWRFTLTGREPFDTLEHGLYFRKIMDRKKAALPQEEAATISKRVGWEKKP